MHRVQITEKLWSLATQKNEQYKAQRYGNTTPNMTYTGVFKHNSNLDGVLGEYAFGALCRSMGIDHKMIAGAGTQDFDIVHERLGVFKVDVKTAGKHTHRYLMQPQKQYDATNYALYIGCRLTGLGVGHHVEIHGWCFKDKLRLLPKDALGLQDATMGVELSALLPMQRFDNIMAKGGCQDGCICKGDDNAKF